VNDIFVMLGVESWKPALGALLLPPTPFALMVLAGGVVMARRRLVGWVLLFAGALGTWFMCTAVAGQALTELPLMRRALLARTAGQPIAHLHVVVTPCADRCRRDPLSASPRAGTRVRKLPTRAACENHG
jgi:hypothetical protein